MRGAKGQIAGTDRKQLLIQRGFRFPWKDDLLVPKLTAWGCRELPEEDSVLIGRSDSHVFVHLSPWTFALSIDEHARYPAVESIIPNPRGIASRVCFSEDDVTLLLKELPQLPGREKTPAPVVLEMEQSVDFPARLDDDDDNKESGEVRLSTCKSRGKPVTLVTDRRHLLRALKLGFREVEIVRADQPVCCRDGNRVFVWMVLGEPKPSTSPPVTVSSINHPPEKESTIMNESNGRPVPEVNGVQAALDPLDEAEAIRGLLTEAQSRLARLINSLKLFKKQSKAVRAAVLSLRDLPPLTP